MSIRKLTLPLSLLVALAACDKHPTLVTYQHLANCPAFSLGDKSGSISGGMFQVFMLRGITNPSNASGTFNFSLSKVRASGVKPGDAGGAWQIMNSGPLFMNPGFSVAVAKGQSFTVPYGQGVLFVVANEGAEAGTKTYLTYTSSGSESVLLSALDSNATPLACGVIDDASLATIHAKQNDYENGYTPDGKKKP